MSDNIDIPIEASGDDGVNRITSAIDRLNESMVRLGENSAVGRLAQQMEQMNAVMATGFANLAATSEKILGELGSRQVAAVEANINQTVAAIEAGGLRMKEADARTWEQIQRGSAANVTRAFNQLAQGIPVEAVEAKLGRMATSTATSLDGQLDRLRQFQENAKSLFATDFKPMAGATEAQMQQAASMNAAWDASMRARSASKVDARMLLGLPSEAETRSVGQQIAAQMRESVAQEMLRAKAASPVDARMLLGLPSETEARSVGRQIAAQMQESVAQEALRARAASPVDARMLLGLPSETEVRSIGQQIAAQMREAVAAEQAIDRQRSLNAAYQTASPASQIRTAAQAQAYGQMGGDAEAKYGSAAAGANALAAAEARLAATGKEAAVAHIELDGALRQAEGAFRGAAHQAGVYGLHHGQLLALLSGGAVAAALHHMAETGSEVEFQLSSLNALGTKANQAPIDFDKFLGIAAGSMTNLKDAAEGVHALAEAGRTQGEAFAALPDLMRLASLGNMSVAQAAELAVESMHAFGKSIGEIGQIGDILTAVATQSNVSIHTLANDMKSAATTGALFNLTMEETAATVGALAERGLTIQPLSSALMKLYEPSAKTAKAMQELGLSVKDSEGNLKNYTQFMGELAAKVNEFRVPADILKNIGMSSRDIKAMEVMTQHLDDYEHLLHEAEHSQGKMFDAAIVKAGTAMGAYEMLGSTLQGSFVRAFEGAQPIIVQVEQELAQLAGSKDVQEFLTGLATGFASLARDIVEHGSAIKNLVLAYGGMKVVSSILAAVASSAIYTTASTAAAATATTTLGTSSVVAGAQLELFAVEEGAAAAGAVALETGAAGAAVTMEGMAVTTRMVTASLGAIGLVLAGVTIAMDLFSSKQSESDKQFQTALNTGTSTLAMYDKEIERLKDLEQQLLQTGKAGVDAANQVALANLMFEQEKAKADVERLSQQAKAGPAGPQASAFTYGVVNKGDFALESAQQRLAKVTRELNEREQKQATLENLRDRTDSESRVAALHDKIDSFPSVIFPADKSKAAQEAADAANTTLQSLRSTVIAESNYEEVKGRELELEKQIAATKKEAKPAAVGDKDGARVRIEQLQEELRIAQALSKEHLADLKSQNKRGELGDLQLINAELADKLALDQKAVDMAKAELAAAGPLKPGQQEKYNSRIKGAEAQKGIDTTAAERARQDLLDKMDGLELQARAKTLADKGLLEDAYNLTWQAKNANLLANLSKDIADADNADYRDRLTRYRAYLEEQRRVGANQARFKEGQNAFNDLNSTLSTRLDNLKNQSGPGTGLGSIVGNTLSAQDTYAAMLPQLKAAQIKVAATSSSVMGGSDSDRKAAENELKVIQDRMAQMRNGFIDLGNTIAKSLTDAFGKGGAAMGGMITTAVAYDAKMKDIQATLDSSDHGAEAKKKAADDTASAQVKAYGDMAGAAKGFFDTNSNGYKIMATAEKAFRVIELAEAGATLAKKLFFKTTEVAANVAGDAAKVTSGTVATGASVANAGTEASAWGITAVVRAIANFPPPMNLIAGAATMAAVIALGVKMTGGFGGSTTAADRQAANGTGTIAGDPKAKSDSIAKSLAAVESNTFNDLNVSQDMLSALRSIEANISSFAGQLLQNSNIAHPEVSLNTSNGLGKTLASWAAGGVVFGSLLAKIPVLGNLFDKVGTAIFGGKQSLDDTGFMMAPTTLAAVAAGGANAKTYADVTTSGGWFSSDKHSTQSTSIGADSNLAITQIITGIGDAIRADAKVLGLAGNEFDQKLNGYKIDLGKISLKGLSSADQQAAIQAAFSKLGDQMAESAVSTITQFSKAGEGALQTLTRVAADYQMVDAVFASYGTAFGEVGLSSIAAREHLIDLAGGLDKFTSQASFFLQNSLTKGQQTAAQRAAIDPTLAKYGLSSVGSDAAANFAKVVIAMGAMGSAGAEAYTELMSIAPAFKAVTDVAKDLQSQLDDLLMTQAQKDARDRAALDPANQGLFDQIQQAKAIAQAKSDLQAAYDNESQAIQTAIDRLKSFSLSLHAFVNSLQLGNLSPLNPTDKYGAAMAQYSQTLAKAKSGDVMAQGNLQSAAQAFLQASRDANASNSTYQADYQSVVKATEGLATIADQQVSDGQANLIALRAQVSQLVDIKTATLSVVDAINNLAVEMGHGTDKTANGTALETLYKELLGRPSDVAGKAYYENLLQQGVSLATIADDIRNSLEYAQHSNGLPVTQPVTPSTQYGTGASGPGADSSASMQVTSLYWNVLNRAPDQAGLDYWVAALNSGMPLSTISDDMKQSDEYTHPATTAAPDTSSMPAVQGPDPYAAAAAQNADLAAGIAAMNVQLAALRAEQQTQTDQLTTATMSAGADTGEQVAEAITTTNQASNWKLQNQMALR